MSDSLEQKEYDQMIAAEDAGYKFMELILNKNRVSRGQKEVRLAGVKVLRCYSKGQNDDGIEEWDFVKSSGQIKFKLDRKKRAYVGYLWDDDQEGIYHRKGYNRDFLASHIDTSDFQIVDELLEQDIIKRKEKMQKKIAEAEAEKQDKKAEVHRPEDDVEDLDKQIEFLKKRREEAAEKIKKKKPGRPARRNPVNPINKKDDAENKDIKEPELTEA